MVVVFADGGGVRIHAGVRSSSVALFCLNVSVVRMRGLSLDPDLPSALAGSSLLSETIDRPRMRRRPQCCRLTSCRYSNNSSSSNNNNNNSCIPV
jgi:hypothetical protein